MTNAAPYHPTKPIYIEYLSKKNSVRKICYNKIQMTSLYLQADEHQIIWPLYDVCINKTKGILSRDKK